MWITQSVHPSFNTNRRPLKPYFWVISGLLSLYRGPLGVRVTFWGPFAPASGCPRADLGPFGPVSGGRRPDLGPFGPVSGCPRPDLGAFRACLWGSEGRFGTFWACLWGSNGRFGAFWACLWGLRPDLRPYGTVSRGPIGAFQASDWGSEGRFGPVSGGRRHDLGDFFFEILKCEFVTFWSPCKFIMDVLP